MPRVLDPLTNQYVDGLPVVLLHTGRHSLLPNCVGWGRREVMKLIRGEGAKSLVGQLRRGRRGGR